MKPKARPSERCSAVESRSLAQLEAALEGQGRGLGAHYTPHGVAERMAHSVLVPLCVGLSPQELLGLRVLDPAVGSGRFLVAALDTLARAAGGGWEARRDIAAACLFGIDVDPRAVALARLALGKAAGCCPDALAGNIAVGDSLAADPPALLGVEAFDAVLGNPPWISYSGRQACALDAARRRLLGSRYQSFRRWPTTHGSFLELAARLLRPGGRAALVLPEQVCHLAGYAPARRAVRALCDLEPPPEALGEGCFHGVVQPAAIVYLLRRTTAEEGMGGWVDDWVGVGPPGRDDSPAAAILDKMRRHPAAPAGTFRDCGVHTGNSAALLLHDGSGPGRVPVREGRCIHPFRLEPPARWLQERPDLPPGRYCRIGRPEAHLDACILLRQTAARPIAARHVPPARFRNSVIACYGVPGLDASALLGLLNSRLVAFWHRRRNPDSAQRTFPQVKVAHLQAIPLAREAGRIVPIVERIEALSARALARNVALDRAMAELDEAVFSLYGLTDVERVFVREEGEESRGRLAAR